MNIGDTVYLMAIPRNNPNGWGYSTLKIKDEYDMNLATKNRTDSNFISHTYTTKEEVYAVAKVRGLSLGD